LILFVGILYFVFWAKSLTADLFFTENTENHSLKGRFFAPHSYGLWLQPLFWFLFSQHFRISRIQKSVLLELLISFSFVFTFEKLIIVPTSMHRDFLTNSWNIVSFDELYYLPFLIKISVYLCFISTLKYLKSIFKYYYKKLRISLRPFPVSLSPIINLFAIHYLSIKDISLNLYRFTYT
jgi:hypothetical protein